MKIAIACLMTGLALSLPVAAADLRMGEQPSLPAGTVQEDAYLLGGNVNSSADLQGDLFVGGGNVSVSGPVAEDLFAAGGSVSIAGNVGDDLRLGGGNVNVSARVGGDLAGGSGQLQVSGEGVGGDLLWAGGALAVNAPVQGDLRAAGSEVRIDAPVGGSVHFKGDRLVIGSNAVIAGDLIYEAREPATIEEGAVIRGTVTYAPLATTTPDMGAALASAAALAGFLMRLAAALTIGLVFKRYSEAMSNEALARPWLELGRGFIVLLVFPAASVILLATVLGLPLGLLGLIAFAGLLLLAALAAPIVLGSLIGRWVFKGERRTTWATILLGVAAYALLGFVPVVGWAVRFVFVLLALGATAKLATDSVKEWR